MKKFLSVSSIAAAAMLLIMPAVFCNYATAQSKKKSRKTEQQFEKSSSKLKRAVALGESQKDSAGEAIKAEAVTLPNGWKLTPVGKQFKLGDLPLNMAVSPNQKWLAVTNNGYGRQCIQLFNTKEERETDNVTIPMSWYGICFSPDSKTLYASGGNENKIRIYSVSDDGKLAQADSIVMGKPWPNHISPSGIVISKKYGQLLVVTRRDNSIYIYGQSKNKNAELQNRNNKSGNSSGEVYNQLIKKVSAGSECYDIVLSKDEENAYVSCWGGKKVKVWNLKKQEWTESYDVGNHPNELCLDKDGERLFVANADDNSVSVIDLQNKRVEEILNAALFPNSLAGSTTNGLCISPKGKKLYVANADNNCVTVFDISEKGESKCLGFIPVGWYPTNVKCASGKLWVTNGKGLKSAPNPYGPEPADVREDFGHHSGDSHKTQGVEYIAGLFLGALSEIDLPVDDKLAEYSKQVYANTPYNQANDLTAEGEPGNPIPAKVGNPSPIKYVFYIIQENRTYDQVLGDIKEGNGDSSLVLFGDKVTPNHHALAKQFVLLDNFYVNAEVSCDGHNWTVGGYANDFLEKTWPTYYSGRGDYYAGEGAQEMGNNTSGFIWDMCKKMGVSYRTYGEFVYRKNGVLVPSVPSLADHFCKTYEPWNLAVRDTIRYGQWVKDFDSLVVANAVPHFQIVRVPNDHTMGMRIGQRTPFAFAADNDLAVGMIIDHLSHSPIWKESVVFIVEDDAQNGADHVDAHRSPCYIAGGFVKRGFVDHTPYTTTSVLRTMELILGLPPMTQYDASARSMWRCFSPTADTTAFHFLPANINLDDRNVKKDKWQAMCEKYNFNKEDAVPDVEFNQMLWHAIKGDGTPYPAIRRSAFLTYTKDADDD
ncbi:MAG: bifunctional YncE family protein/alkaline phosphatase family protein [Bacteroidales bacterium]|jgi:YVTN family beta-propeller protein|nr:bifunctional YncE family protein/alkaline phosphatase family protein [Bacteroidales bacterium]MCI1733926.1 bifunctional YncE family protein/alkaline phosphatase family protein [Bacteroidales bacterium]